MEHSGRPLMQRRQMERARPQRAQQRTEEGSCGGCSIGETLRVRSVRSNIDEAGFGKVLVLPARVLNCFR